MLPDETLRAFLLGMSEDEASSRIEEAILDGSMNLEDLLLVEEELIDDYVFGRLSLDETQHFNARFLEGEEWRGKINFSRSIHKHALEQANRASSFGFWPFSRIASATPTRAIRPLSPRFAVVGWRFALVAMLACFLAATVWLGLRTIQLSGELAESARAANERERLLTSLMDRKERGREETGKAKQLAGQTTSAVRSAAEPAPLAASRSPQTESEIRLTPGVSRGVERLAVLHLMPRSTLARITLELPFKPEGTVREELFRSGGERVWSQEFSSADSIVTHGTTDIDLPAKLLSPGDYRLKFEETPTGATSGGGVNYVFRVRAE